MLCKQKRTGDEPFVIYKSLNQYYCWSGKIISTFSIQALIDARV